jgi:hypothetical protein
MGSIMVSAHASYVNCVCAFRCASRRLSMLACVRVDAYMGPESIHDKDFSAIKSKAEAVCGEKQRFERIVLTKQEVCALLSGTL